MKSNFVDCGIDYSRNLDLNSMQPKLPWKMFVGTSIPLTRSSWVDTTGHSEQNVTGMDICLWSTELLPLVKTTIWAPLHELTVDGDFVNNI